MSGFFWKSERRRNRGCDLFGFLVYYLLCVEKGGGLWSKYREMILYVLFGVVTTAVNQGAYWLLAGPFAVPYLWATALAQVLAILVAYITNRRWVFQSQAKDIQGIALEMIRFFSARGATFLLDLGCMYVGVELLHINDNWMKFFSNVVVILVNYMLSKAFVFRKKGKTPRRKD